MADSDYGELDISYKIYSIKEKLVGQYIKNKNITLDRAWEKIRKQPNMGNKVTEIAVQKLRLLENSKLKVKDYLSDHYLKRHGASL
jgi:hypothetical protein